MTPAQRLALWLGASCVVGAASAGAAAAPPDGCLQPAPAAVAAMQRQARLAAYYDHKLALVGDRVYEWQGSGAPRLVLQGARHVSVGKAFGYAIDGGNRALQWPLDGGAVTPLLEQVALISAGESGLLAIRCDGSLWERGVSAGPWRQSADSAVHAWVGDSADYYIDAKGGLHARGLAHRGQYGDGRLAAAPGWTRVSDEALQVVAHTGHALYLRRDGAVLGTGGNRFGPLGSHGHGDKASSWGVVFDGATAVATGSRHTAALTADGRVWLWGAAEGLRPLPTRLLAVEIAAGLDSTLAIDAQGAVWEWRVGERPSAPVPMPAKP
ncbi:hypothetical protein [Variovorax saccharolyticus]|uniref:hypothetical protein n=1 Tax=Variovorax saccharolyticus TaxID=3053516 RepID=UPI0025758E93|nr:hypothetical protein [Variovorax sp. J31P216]MDM0025459.1 hypothetical protein [Variovorax sp. J31P216]